uniref:Gamma-glutamylcyclotransferase family protein n=1 Tax=Anopheles christyi TaxID=43041 RepID=A0A182JQ59_9DIPT
MAQKALRRVFVYGTLKRGEPNHHLLANADSGYAKFICKGSTNRRFPLVVATRYNIPFLLDKPGTGSYVTGEIYEVDDPLFEQLDVLEDYRKLYDRQVEDINVGIEGGNLPCWLYLLRNCPDRLLKLPMLTKYRNTLEHPYSRRPPGKVNIFEELLKVTFHNIMSPTLRRVFVYGTLKRGEPNHHWLTDVANGQARFIAKGRTIVQYPLVVATRHNIPFLLDMPGTGHLVAGEIYEIDDRMLGRLDVLEDYPRLYDRRPEEIRCEVSNTVECCWVYLMRSFPKRLLELPLLEEYRDSTEKPYVEADHVVFDE